MKKICLSIFATVVFVLYITTSIHAQEPFKFLGLKFGVAISEQNSDISLYNPIPVSGSPMYQVSGLNKVGIYFDKSIVHIVEGKVESLSLYMKSSNVRKMIDLVSEKYGKPDSFKQEQVKTLRGIELSKITANWKLEGITLMANDRSDAISGYFFVHTNKYTTFLKEQAEKDKKNSIGNL